MSFASFEYAALLSLVFVLFWSLGGARQRVPRLLVLLGASYVFYGWWRVGYLLLIVVSSGLDFVVGWKLHRARAPRARKLWLLVSLVGNLGLLGVFKYFNFFADNVAWLLALLGVEVSAPHLGVELPVGISFFTFQSMSYTIDIYRRQLEPVPYPLPFFVFVAFFPQLVAGPIVRARQFLPQLAAEPQLTASAGARGYLLIGVGLLKKTVIADLLAVNLVDRVFETPQLYTSAELLAGVYGYALQIYCDFSAYSDIAIGSALLLGLTLPQNFDSPYRARDLRDFWRRWHISLSSWLRDYLYIPLGGSRGPAWATYRNLALTMLLGGLWHGAAWNFVIWGALHGGGLAVTRAWQRWRGERQPGRAARLLGVLFTFHLVCLGWIFFRAPSFTDASSLLRGLFAGTPGTANITPLLWCLLAAGFATHLAPARTVDRASAFAARLPGPVQAALLVGVVLAVRYAGVTEVAKFIYFQF